MAENKYTANVSTNALIFNAILCLFAIGFFTIWSPLFAKVSCRLSHDNKRIKGETGIFKKVSMDAPISKISSVSVEQSVLGRMMNYGTIRINLSGDNVDYDFPYIDEPDSFKESLLSLVE